MVKDRDNPILLKQQKLQRVTKCKNFGNENFIFAVAFQIKHCKNEEKYYIELE